MADPAPVTTAAPAADPAPGGAPAPAAAKADATANPTADSAPAQTEAKTETPNEARLRKLAIAAQKDRAAAIKARAEADAIKARADKLDEFKTTKTPEKWLKENLGIEAADLFKRLSDESLAAQGGEVEPTAEERLTKLESDRKAEIDANLAAQEKAVRAAVKEQLSSSANVPGESVSWADKYELINAYNKFDAVFDEVDAYCKAHPNMTAEEVNAAYLEVADAQEAQLEAEHIEPAAKTKKFAKKFAGRPATETPDQSEGAQASKEAPKQSGDKPKPSTTTLTGLGRSTPTTSQLPKNLSKNSATRIRQIIAWQREQGISQ